MQQQVTHDYTLAAEHLWRRLQTQKPAQFSDPHLESLSAEDAILFLHAAIQPHAKAFRTAHQQQPWFLFLFLNPLIQVLTRITNDSLFGIVIAALLLVIAIVVFYLVRSRHAKVNVGAQLIRLLPNCRTPAVLPALLDFAIWTEGPHKDPNDLLLHNTIARLLLRTGDGELRQVLTEEHKVLLRSWCERKQLPSAISAAALLALGSVRDQLTRPIAQRLLETRPECHDAAQAFLDSLS